MKVCFALLLDAEVHNYARKLALRLDREFGTGMIAAFLPQHVTLSPAFAVTDLEEAERCFDRLSAGWNSLTINLTELALKISACGDSAVIWMEVAANQQLSTMQREIIRAVESRGWPMDPPPCGEPYVFHSTVVMGKLPADQYRQVFASIPELRLDMECTVREAVMFCPAEAGRGPGGTYFSYKIRPLGV
jgi:2'-5' RNA ligase